MKRELRIHFVVPAAAGQAAPAPHHVSGNERIAVGQLGNGKANVVACNPAIVLSEWDNGTGEPWQVACADCFQTEVFKIALATEGGHPRTHGRPTETAVVPGCCG